MCTAIAWNHKDFYFGRNLDLEYSFQEQIIITPRNYEFIWRNQEVCKEHYAMIGIGTITKEYPLYADATNEKGLSIAGLNFPSFASYHEPKEGYHNIAPFEIIPWLLGQCATVNEAITLLKSTNITAVKFIPEYPLAPLHWMLSDADQSIVIEPMEDGLKIHENPYHVLTNNPPFPYHRYNIQNYLNVTAQYPNNQFQKNLKLAPLCQGIGGFGLPGDYSSPSRFIKAAFVLHNSHAAEDEISSVSQFFHILDSVAMVSGSVLTQENKCDITTYSCCINATKGIYYYKTYNNSQLHAVALHNENLDQSNLISYSLQYQAVIPLQNS